MKTLIIILSLLLNISLFAQKELSPYLKTAAENNAGIKAAFSEYNASLQMLPQAKTLPDPELMFQYFITPPQWEMGKQQFNLSISQLFPWFGQLKAQEKVAAEMAKAKYESFINERNRLFMEVKSTYFKWYVQHQSVKLTEENLKLLQSFREIAKTKFEVGKGSLVNVLRADMEIAEMENNLLFLKEEEMPLKSEFEKLLNTKNLGELQFPETLWKDSLPDNKTALFDSIAANNPSLKKMAHEIVAWENQIIASKKMGYPSIKLGVQYMNMAKREGEFPSNGKDMWMFPEVGLSIPIYRKKYRAMVNEANYKSESANYQKIEITNELNSKMEMNYRDYVNAQRSIILYKRLLELAKNARELLLSSFSGAGSDFEEVLRMQKQELVYALRLEEARAMLNTSVAKITNLTGKE
ncbi:MAG: hypothetical protein COX70_03515 [Flavobacteriales bacterium CG_4_10_14_0_2_um_filter_32_8]|nr:MAG: hypothetical protein COX70_03515 [Flavobacteriales bacterium CG_4_10_14_0_2_um_filter_32_8]PJB16130.1 MAG: hypothetical protein CO118_00965 [Flavobacteriales bacterium CG_4_9_14_3_um_filter_32_8]